MFDIISIGDTTLDVFLTLEDAKIQCDNNQEDCLLCVSYPDKVSVKSKTDVPAVGNAANQDRLMEVIKKYSSEIYSSQSYDKK